MKRLFIIGKSAILVLLIVTSMYQTGRLWFENQSGRNFFYNVLPDNNVVVTDTLKEIGNLLVPKQMAVFIGQSDIEYTVIKSGVSSYEVIREAMVKILSIGLEKNSYVGVLEDENIIWQRQHIMMTLPFEYEKEVFTDNLGLSSNVLKNIESVGMIIIEPATIEEENLSIYIEDFKTKQIYEYKVKKSRVSISNELLYNQIRDISISENQSMYISTLKNTIGYYSQNILLPVPSEAIRYHDYIFRKIPYLKDNKVDHEAFQIYASIFFDNPDIMQPVISEDTLRYTDGNVVVKYNNDGILEYNRVNDDIAGKLDISTATTIANQFLEADIGSTATEYYLREYEFSETTAKFYYATGYNGFPFVFSESISEQYNMSYPIEITVTANKVTNYKRVIRTIDEVIPQNKVFTAKYEKAVDKLIEDVGDVEGRIKDMFLGYEWDTSQGDLELHWVIVLDNKTYFFPVD